MFYDKIDNYDGIGFQIIYFWFDFKINAYFAFLNFNK
jgi:hypothetical protein